MTLKTSAALRNQFGLSIVEGLVATAIVVTTAVGTASLVSYIGKQSRRTQLLNRAVTVQSTLVNGVLDKTQYSTSTNDPVHNAKIQQFIASRSATGLPILAHPEVTTPLPAGTSAPFLAIVGRRVGYNIDDTSATVSCGEKQCPIWVDFDIRCIGLSQGCRAAYRITTTPLAKDDVVPAPLGAPGVTNATNPGAFVDFDPSDYTLPISYDFFEQRPMSDCSGDADSIFITGVDRTTGEVSCIRKDTNTCPAPMIAHGVAVDIVDGRRALMLQCHPLANVQCDDNYVLQAMDFGRTDPGQDKTKLHDGGTMNGLHGVCVYRWKDNIAWEEQGPTFRTASTASTATYRAKVCNTSIYNAQTAVDCAIVWDSNPVIHCPNTCPDFNSSGVQIGSHDCSYDIQATATKSSQAPAVGNGNIGICTVTVTQDSCSGGPTAGVAHGVSSGRCQTKEKAINPTLTKKPKFGVLGL